MKFRLEIRSDAEEELVLRCKTRTRRICELERTLSSLIEHPSDLVLTQNDTEYYIPKNEILFFETEGGRVTAHTAKEAYQTAFRLYELESLIPRCFLRVSKSCVLNAEAVHSLSRSLTGTGEVRFVDSEKHVFVSRAYYKYLRERIYQLRVQREDLEE